MEFTFNLWRIVVLIVLVTAYALWGGFSVPDDVPTQLMKNWMATLVLFLASAVSTTLVDHWVGNLDRSNLRWLYIAAGVAGMGGAMILLHVFRERMAML